MAAFDEEAALDGKVSMDTSQEQQQAVEVKIVRSWDGRAVASLLAAESAGVLDQLDPSEAWGRPPDVRALNAERLPLWAGGDLPPWFAATHVRTLQLSAFFGASQVGFCVCAVIRRLGQEAEPRACRICFEDNVELLDCCACRGTMRFICSDCLIAQWSAKAANNSASLKCGLCNQNFEGRAQELLTQKIRSAVQKHESDFPLPSPAEKEERYKMHIVTATQLWRQGKHTEAAALFRKTIPGLEAQQGPGDPLVLSAQHNLGLLLVAQGHFQEAETHVGVARTGFAKLYGSEHPLSLKAGHNAAMIAQLRGQLLEARGAYESVLSARQRVLGPDNLDTLKTSCNLGLVMLTVGDKAEAEALLRATLRDMERVVGRRHPLALVALQNLSLALAEHEPVPLEAEELAREAVDGKQRALGPEHPETLEGRRDLATVLTKSGREAEAEEALRQALESMQRLFGLDHPTTEKVAQQLEELLERRGRGAEAQKLREARAQGTAVSIAKEAAPALPPEGSSLLVALLGIYVALPHRKQGCGREMVLHCQALASELHAEALETFVPSQAVDTLAFFLQCGFQEEVQTAKDADAPRGSERTPLRLKIL